jgi:hypothetical protein
VSSSKPKDQHLLTFYDGVRQQVELDIRFGGRYRFAGEGVKQYAEEPSRGNGAAAIAFHAD